MFKIQNLTALDVAFPASVSHLMPAYTDIPKEFKGGHGKWNTFFADWFYRGLVRHDLQPRDGVDTTQALRHIKAIIGSFEPQHEHKEAAVAFLMNEWFSDGTWTAKSK